MPWWFYLLVACGPLVAFRLRRNAVGVVLWTIAVTWVVTTLAAGAFPGDSFVVFLLVVKPMLVVVTSTLVATSLAPGPRRWFEVGPRRWFEAAFLAALGWWIGFVVLVFAPLVNDVWEDALLVALPAVYGASGAAVGATLPR